MTAGTLFALLGLTLAPLAAFGAEATPPSAAPQPAATGARSFADVLDLVEVTGVRLIAEAGNNRAEVTFRNKADAAITLEALSAIGWEQFFLTTLELNGTGLELDFQESITLPPNSSTVVAWRIRAQRNDMSDAELTELLRAGGEPCFTHTIQTWRMGQSTFPDGEASLCYPAEAAAKASAEARREEGRICIEWRGERNILHLLDSKAGCRHFCSMLFLAELQQVSIGGRTYGLLMWPVTGGGKEKLANFRTVLRSAATFPGAQEGLYLIFGLPQDEGSTVEMLLPYLRAAHEVCPIRGMFFAPLVQGGAGWQIRLPVRDETDEDAEREPREEEFDDEDGEEETDGETEEEEDFEEEEF